MICFTKIYNNGQYYYYYYYYYYYCYYYYHHHHHHRCCQHCCHHLHCYHHLHHHNDNNNSNNNNSNNNSNRKEGGGQGLVNIHRLCRTQDRYMRNKLRSTEECWMRLAVHAVKRYSSLKLNDQNMEDDVTITHPENKNFTRKVPKLCTQIMWSKNPPCCGLPHAISILISWDGRLCRCHPRQVNKTRNYEKHCLGLEVIDRCRKYDKVGKTIEHVITGCSPSESAFLGRHS